MGRVKVAVEGVEIEAPPGTTLIAAAQSRGVYIPALCRHPDLTPPNHAKSRAYVYRGSERFESFSEGQPFEGCGLCFVEVEGTPTPIKACETLVEEGMKVKVNTPQLQKLRRERLARILANHPHTCLTCAQREGCSREPCSLGVPVEERCCVKFGWCEVQRVAEYVGIKEDTPRYRPLSLPKIVDEPLFTRDYNLCIGCTRCVRACNDLKEVGALAFIPTANNNGVRVGSVGSTMKESGCRFCGACIQVCPTGALMDKEIDPADFEASLVPCRNTCPLGMDAPRYVRLISERRFGEASLVIREKTPLAQVLGRVCHHPCETVCRRGKIDQPVSICALKRFALTTTSRDLGLSLETPPPTGKKVAIIGGGPAGLTAAYYLRGKGHLVTVFDYYPRLGGMMLQAIPPYRLPRDIAEGDIETVEGRGVDFRPLSPEGLPLALEGLRKEGFDAVLLTLGTPVGRGLKVEGYELEGVGSGLEFLKQVNRGEVKAVEGRIVVVGGGNVAVDVALTALRLGAKEARMVCLESRREMPAHSWEVEEALEEGIALENSWGVEGILGDGDRVAGVDLARCTSVFDDQGRFNPTFDKTQRRSLTADMVLLAIGQSSDFSLLGEDLRIETTRDGRAVVDKDTLMTSIPGVFAAGDVVRGPGSIVEASAQGRSAASSIDRFLGGDGQIEEKLSPSEEPSQRLEEDTGFADRGKAKMTSLPLDQRLKGFEEVELGLGEEEAVAEAKRCLGCHLRLKISGAMLPPEQWFEFTQLTVSAVPEISGVYQLLDEGKAVFYIAGTPNLRKALEEQLSSGSKARYFGFEEAQMYTQRESELLQQHLQKHGALPKVNVELDEDLYS